MASSKLSLVLLMAVAVAVVTSKSLWTRSEEVSVKRSF